MIDKYRLEDLRRESGENGELARWVIQLQKDLDDERRKTAASLSLLAEREADKALIAELQGIRAAAEKLVRCKGRYHSEQNYRALAALFGVNTPELPPLDNEACTLTVDLRKHLVNEVMIISQMDRQYSEGWCSANDWAILKIREACAAAGITLKVGGE